VSSTNAHGVLPQYAGSAAASLNPAMSVSGGGAPLAPSSSDASSPAKTPAKSPKQAENVANGRQSEYMAKPVLTPM
jgi:hypothetical protein